MFSYSLFEVYRGCQHNDTKPDRYNRVGFQSIVPEAPRQEARLPPNSSSGILAWKAVKQIGCPGADSTRNTGTAAKTKSSSMKISCDRLAMGLTLGRLAL